MAARSIRAFVAIVALAAGCSGSPGSPTPSVSPAVSPASSPVTTATSAPTATPAPTTSSTPTASATKSAAPTRSPTVVEGRWEGAGTLAWARREPTATLLGDGRVLVVGDEGGKYEGVPRSSRIAEIWDPATSAWRETQSLPSVPLRADQAMRGERDEPNGVFALGAAGHAGRGSYAEVAR
jgi:hypothetical protein